MTINSSPLTHFQLSRGAQHERPQDARRVCSRHELPYGDVVMTRESDDTWPSNRRPDIVPRPRVDVREEEEESLCYEAACAMQPLTRMCHRR